MFQGKLNLAEVFSAATTMQSLVEQAPSPAKHIPNRRNSWGTLSGAQKTMELHIISLYFLLNQAINIPADISSSLIR